MLLSTRLKLLVTVWFVSEVLVFIGVAELIGFGWALLASFTTTIIGFSLLKRAGAAAMMRLRGAFQGRHDGGLEDVLDGTMATVAAVALILPGFLSDIVGLMLAVPAIRGHAARWVRAGGLGIRVEAKADRAGPQTIDLERGEWTRTRPSKENGGLLR